MGSILSKKQTSYVYSVPIRGTETPNSTAIRRNILTVGTELVSNFENPLNNCWELILHGLKVSNDSDYLGERIINEDGTFGEYQFKKYSEIIAMAKEIGSGLIHIKGFEDTSYDNFELKLRCIAIFGKNCMNWSITEQACHAYDLTSIPLYDVMRSDGILHILNSTKPLTVFCSCVCAERLIPILNLVESIKFLIILDNIKPNYSIPSDISNRVTIMTFNELRDIGRKNMKKPTPGNLNSINSIHYTSGTTGLPKGAILINSNWIACTSAFLRSQLGHKENGVTHLDIHISYLPLAHIFERIVHMVLGYSGGKIGFCSGSIQKIVEDIQVLKPTFFVTVPRLLNRLYDKIMTGLEEKQPILRFLFNLALEQKEKRNSPYHILWDAIVFRKVRDLLGGNIRVILSGSAPLDKIIQSRIRSFVCVPCFEGYGMSEILAAFLPEIDDYSLGTIGGPAPCYEFKLVSVSDMGYNIKNNPPSGELYVRGPASFIGYFLDKEGTENVISSDGWIKTGDICELLNNGSIRIIDRRKSIFKLAQGEYIAPEKLENIYLTCELVSQVLVIGKPTESSIVALFVLDEEFTMNYMKNNNLGADLTFKQAIQHPKLLKKIADELKRVEDINELYGYERVKAFRCITEQFTVENDMMTPTFKIIRHKAIKYYEEIIDELYDEINSKLASKKI
ncbi:putative long-chain fatty acid CoA ligase [Cryptosporidium serpentis]